MKFHDNICFSLIKGEVSDVDSDEDMGDYVFRSMRRGSR